MMGPEEFIQAFGKDRQESEVSRPSGSITIALHASLLYVQRLCAQSPTG